MNRNNMRTTHYINLITVVLLGLFFFTGMEKMWYHQSFVITLGRQPLTEWMKSGLAWGLPLAELAVVGLLVADQTRLIGLMAATLAMLSFAGYTAYAATEPTGYVPCACGKLFNSLTWGQHFWVNMGFVALAATGLWLHYRARKTNSTVMETLESKAADSG